MTQVDSLVLEHLRALRAGQERVEAKLSEVSARLNSLESALVRARADQLGAQDDVYRQQAALDRLSERLELAEP